MKPSNLFLINLVFLFFISGCKYLLKEERITEEEVLELATNQFKKVCQKYKMDCSNFSIEYGDKGGDWAVLFREKDTGYIYFYHIYSKIDQAHCGNNKSDICKYHLSDKT